MRCAAVALAALTVLRLVVASVTPLTPDEAYYWVWSRALAAGYYDHPPMVAVWIWAGTILFGDSALGVRLLAPFSAALGSVLLARAGTDLSGANLSGANLFGDRRVGFWAAVLLNATLAFGLGAVSMTPDTPLLLFWILAIFALGRLLATGQGAWFILVGIAVGLALASKLSAAFLAVGIALWLLWVPSLRSCLRTPWPWIGALAALALFAPVIAWNAAHGWAGFLRQGGRLGGFRPEHAAGYLLELIGGQAGLLTPVIFLFAFVGVVRATGVAWRERAPAASLLALLSLPPLLVFLQHTLADRVQGNWPAIIYPAAVLAGAIWVGPAWPRWRIPAAVVGFGLTALVTIQATLAIFPIPPRLDPSMKRLAGWPELAGAVDSARLAEGAAFVTSDDYAVASRLAFALPGVTFLVTNPRWQHFDLPRMVPEGPGILVRSARLAERTGEGPWQEQIFISTAARTRAGVTAEEYRFFRVTARVDSGLVTRLPSPGSRRAPR